MKVRRRGGSVFWVEGGVRGRRTWCGVKSCQTCGGLQSDLIPAFPSAVVGDNSVACAALDNEVDSKALSESGKGGASLDLAAAGESPESSCVLSRGLLVGEAVSVPILLERAATGARTPGQPTYRAEASLSQVSGILLTVSLVFPSAFSVSRSSESDSELEASTGGSTSEASGFRRRPAGSQANTLDEGFITRGKVVVSALFLELFLLGLASPRAATKAASLLILRSRLFLVLDLGDGEGGDLERGGADEGEEDAGERGEDLVEISLELGGRWGGFGGLSSGLV